MSVLTIRGGNRLEGRLAVQGAKNSVLPLLAASLMTRERIELHNCPRISDVSGSLHILEMLGCRVVRDDHEIAIYSDRLNDWQINEAEMRKMRSTILFLAPLLTRTGKAELSLPGGCELGARPIDFHLSALRQMGMVYEANGDRLLCTLPEGRFVGTKIRLPIPSVGATEQIMIAAAGAKGTTTIHNAAREPEITDLAEFLNSMGAEISGSGEDTIEIRGREHLVGTSFSVMPDRIVAITYMAAVAATGGRLELTGIRPEHFRSTVPLFIESGCQIRQFDDRLYLKAPKRLNAIKRVVTGYYPGFSTDAQPMLMAMAAAADGTSVFIENIFDNRYRHGEEMIRFGADIRIEDRMAVVSGQSHLLGTAVSAADLRGGAALALCGLCSEGITQVHNSELIHRGYEDFAGCIDSIGGDIIDREG